MNIAKELDVVELWYVVESMVVVGRVARVAGHPGHQHIQAEGFDNHRYLAVTVQKG